MEIFNIHIFEFLLIAGLALVVFGPERLPEVGRFIGQQVAKFLAWQQQSPELQMLNEVRGEFEREIASLRDELVRTRQQLDISRDVNSIKEELRPMLDLKGNLTNPAAANGVKPTDLANGAADAAKAVTPTSSTPAPAVPEGALTPAQAADVAETAADAARVAADMAETAAEAAENAAELAQAAVEPPLVPQPAAQTVPSAVRPNRVVRAEPTAALGTPPPPVGDQQFAEPPVAPAAETAPVEEQPRDERAEYLRRRRESLHDAPEADPEPAPAAPAALAEDEREQLLGRLQRLAAEFQALTAELQERGVIRPDWQRPAAAPEQETIHR